MICLSDEALKYFKLFRDPFKSPFDVQKDQDIYMSEDHRYIEAAMLDGEAQGWRAGEPGRQVIRLLFASPQPLRRIWLRFAEPSLERTQEFVLRWSPDAGQSFREIVRQQWNFSPPNTIREIEEYQLGISDITVLELIITPEVSHGTARASIKSIRLR